MLVALPRDGESLSWNLGPGLYMTVRPCPVDRCSRNGTGAPPCLFGCSSAGLCLSLLLWSPAAFSDRSVEFASPTKSGNATRRVGPPCLPRLLAARMGWPTRGQARLGRPPLLPRFLFSLWALGTSRRTAGLSGALASESRGCGGLSPRAQLQPALSPGGQSRGQGSDPLSQPHPVSKCRRSRTIRPFGGPPRAAWTSMFGVPTPSKTKMGQDGTV